MTLSLPPQIRTTLPNGLTVLVRRDISAPAAAIVTYVKAGYFDETDDVVGIAHVLEHMYFKGTPTRGVGEIARDTKAAGGDLNAHTIYDHTSYYTVLPASGFTDGVAIQADAYAHSMIDAGELARELEVIIQEVKRKEDAPAAVAAESLYALRFDQHRMRRWRIGRPEQLRTFTRDQVVAFYRNFYQPANTVLSIVGDVDPDRALHLISQAYGALANRPVDRSPGPTEPRPSTPTARYREWTGDIAQTQIVCGWHTQPTLHPDTPLLDLVGTIMATGRASRLYRAVRERQLATSVSAYHYTPTEIGVFVIHAECPPATARDAAEAVWADLRDLRERGVSRLDLERAQRIVEARWLRRRESMDGQATHLAEWEALGSWEFGEQHLDRLLNATPEAVTAVVREYLVPEQAAIAVYRPSQAPPVDFRVA